MNGSRSNTPGYGGKSSLDQLNRTIEGLEARIQGLVGDRKPPLRSSPVDEILERQRALGARDRVAAAIERAPQHEPEARYREDSRRQAEIRQPTWNEPVRAAQLVPQSAALDDIAATLAALRSELKQGLGNGRLSDDLGDIRNEMRSLKSAAAHSNGGADVIRNELIRLSDSIERLGGSTGSREVEALRADLGDLRAVTAGLAREDSLRRLENRWDRTESALSSMDPDALKQEMVQLAWRIDDMKAELGELSAAPAVRALEDKLIALAGSIETLGRNVEARGDLSSQFGWLDRRLDEISRAIAAGASQAAASTDSAAFQRLEGRIAELTSHVDMLHAPTREGDIADRIEALTARIDSFANEDAAQRLEDRIGQLSRLIERNFHDAPTAPEFSHHLADISRKIDHINAPADALMDRLDLLTRKLDELERPVASIAASQPADPAAMSRMEDRLADIAARLNETVAAPAADTGAIRNLERQMASLSALLSQSEHPVAVTHSDAPSDRAAIEDYFASSDEFIVEAARQAAEAVVEAYSRSNMGNVADISAIAGLAEDLRALEAHTRQSEERTAETFTALHETLVQIANRLDDIGERPSAPMTSAPAMPVERETAYQPAPVLATVKMPKATIPDFSDAPTAEEARARLAPKHSKVDVLQDVEMLLDTADADLDAGATGVSPAVPAKDKPASKSMLAGLAAKLLPGKKDKGPERVSVDPAPALDASEMMVASEGDSLLMEPGSGVPDVRKIMEKVRAGQKSGNGAGKTAPAGQADVIAAARRAAQAAAQETGSQKFTQTEKGKDKAANPGKQAGSSKSIFGAAGETRRPILLAAAAVLLVVLSYPLVSSRISSHHPDPVLAAPVVDVVPADRSLNADKLEKPAAQANLDAKPPVKKNESGSEMMMAPADDVGNATPLQKSDATTTDSATVPGTGMSAPADKSTAVEDKAAMVAATSNAIAPAASEIELPAGLQPASLVEAVKKADPLAYFEIGARYTDGRGGMKVDLQAAAKWYQLAVNKGFAPAEYRLGSLYEKGTGVARDLDKARSLYLSAAEKGNASAMHNLAVLYATGAAGTPDFNEAARWFQAAADLNVRDSQFNLAILYARGSGVKQDLMESYKWFAVAARQGDQDAAEKRDEVANAMSAEQLKTAKARLDLWKPKSMNDSANSPLVPDEWVAKGNTTASVDMKRAIRNIQAILINNGFDAGKPDGEMGTKTVLAIKAFQKSIGQAPTGRIDDALVQELLKRNKKATESKA